MAAGLYPGIEMNPMWGAAAMALSSFTVCMNALRLNLFRMHDASGDRKPRGTLPAAPDAGEKRMQAAEPDGKENGAPAAADGREEPAGSGRRAEESGTTETVFRVGGMMCANCERHVREALEGIPGVTEASADHTTGRVTVRHTAPLDEDAVRAAVTDEGYEYAGAENP